MNFDLGYLVVLGVVVVILIVYRQLDKNNRSLEKIRKFGDSVRADLGGFIEERTARIKDFETELKVHDKTAAEVLKRIKAVEENLLTRTPEIEALQKRLDDYGTSLNGLHDMSARVDENLARLKEESEFVDKVGRRLKLASEQMTALESRIPAVKDEVFRHNSSELEALKAQALAFFDQETKAYAVKLSEANAKVDQFTAFIRSLEEKKTAFLESSQKALAESIAKGLSKAEDTLRSHDQELVKRALAHEKALDAQEKDFHKRMDASAHQADKLSLEVLEKISKKIASDAKALEEKMRAELEHLGRNFNGGVDDLVRLMEDGRGEFSVYQTELHRDMDGLRTKLESFEGLAEKEIKAGQNKVAQELQTAQTQVMALVAQLKSEVEAKMTLAKKDILDRAGEAGDAMDQKLKDFEVHFSYRLQKMEEVEKDIQLMDQNLRQSMERVAVRIQDDFKAFDLKMSEKRQAEHQLLEERYQKTLVRMSELEKGLEDLKSRAYDNVSEKLQVFEEEFFLDLQKRSAALQQAFDEWQRSSDLKMEELTAKTEKDRLAVERSYTDLVRQKTQEMQSAAIQSFEKWETQFRDYQESLGAQVKTYQALIDDTSQKLKAEIVEMEKSAHAKFEQEAARREIASAETLTKLERDVEAKTRQITEKLELGRGELQAAMDGAASDVNIWQTRANQKFKELEIELEEQYRGFKTFLSERIGHLSEEFNAQKDDLVYASNEERSALRSELTSLRQDVDALESGLKSRSAEALEQFRKDYDGFTIEYQKRNRDLQNEVDLKIKDFRQAVQDTKEKAESLQKKFFGKIEDHYNLLVVNIEEIDKKQKAFLAQTKLFERADALKSELTESMEDLKTDIAKVEIQKKELFEIENQIVRIKKVGDEVSDKFNRFLVEKKRIDALGSDFQKVISLSQAMELRLEQVTQSHDTLQDIQFKIRKLEDYEKDVESKYERLEKRKEVLDLTSDGVDRNFALLERMEKSMKTLAGDLAAIPSEVEELKKRMKALSQGREEVDSAVSKVTHLDAVLRDIENRILRMEEARDWLARTETRLQEAGKEAEEHVKLLGTLARGNSATAVKSKGAPALDVRQSVVKLAHQGWSKEEIARATKLSLGEVELILELGPR